MIKHPKAQLIKHPSGALHEAFCEFFASRPGAAWYQSDECFRHASSHASAEVCLLVALHEERLSDPGAHFGLKQPEHQASRGDRAVGGGRNLIAGSLLAIRLDSPTKKKIAGIPDGFQRKLGSRILVAGGPLLADGSRLQKEIALKTLVRALQDRFSGQAVYTRIFGSEAVRDFPGIFRELGFRRQNEVLMQTDLDSLADWSGESSGHVPIPGRERKEPEAQKTGELVNAAEGFFRVNDKMRYVIAKILSLYR